MIVPGEMLSARRLTLQSLVGATVIPGIAAKHADSVTPPGRSATELPARAEAGHSAWTSITGLIPKARTPPLAPRIRVGFRPLFEADNG